MSDVEGYEVARITIVRMVADDGDTVTTDWTDDAGLIELLGMVEYARDAIFNCYPSRFTSEDDLA